MGFSDGLSLSFFSDHPLLDDQVTAGQERVMQEHAWAGVAHDLSDPALERLPVAVNPAVFARGFVFLERALGESECRVLEQLCAVGAELRSGAGCMVMTAIDLDHCLDGFELACNRLGAEVWIVWVHGHIVSRVGVYARSSTRSTLIVWACLKTAPECTDGEDSRRERRGRRGALGGGGMRLYRSSFQQLPWSAETVYLKNLQNVGAEHGTYPPP